MKAQRNWGNRRNIKALTLYSTSVVAQSIPQKLTIDLPESPIQPSWCL
ncbi:MAG: hypothetical protein QOF74_8961 [Caballeronia mineralivorans]|jgi:hypothetical protein|nr:hypothetical protein [Caballeronia mineralivorans]